MKKHFILKAATIMAVVVAIAPLGAPRGRPPPGRRHCCCIEKDLIPYKQPLKNGHIRKFY